MLDDLEVKAESAVGVTCREVEIRIRKLDHERGYIIGRDGRVREETIGEDRRVDMDWASIVQGEISVHNHVVDDFSPPSPRDWLMLLDWPAGEMRVVSENWTYTLKAPAGGWPFNHRFRRYWTGEKMRFGLNLKEMIVAVPRRINDLLPHWYDDERKRQEGSELLHQAWMEIAREVGAAYSREPAWEKLLGEMEDDQVTQ
jgi:hypothetical protein